MFNGNAKKLAAQFKMKTDLLPEMIRYLVRTGRIDASVILGKLDGFSFTRKKQNNYEGTNQNENGSEDFGGCEWYFICPATGKRCRTLYGIGKYFLSRFAYPSAMYSDQTKSKRYRNFSKAFGCLDLQRNFLNKRYARTMYKGKLTKRFQRVLEKETRFDPMAIRLFLNG